MARGTQERSNDFLAEELKVTPLSGWYADPIRAVICGTDRNGIVRLTMPHSLTEGAEVRLEAEDGRYCATGRILYCLGQSGAYTVTVQTDGSERRREARITVAEYAHLVSMQPHVCAVDCQVYIADISKSGMGLITPKAIPAGTLLKVTLPEAIVFGGVRHCSRTTGDADSFKVGVEIETVIFRDERASKWRVSVKSIWSRFVKS